MVKPTPGPWSVDLNADERGADIISAAGEPFCNCWPCDALLIAAAPELLAALEKFAYHFGPLEDNEMLHEDCRECFRLARVALAKARGES